MDKNKKARLSKNQKEVKKAYKERMYKVYEIEEESLTYKDATWLEFVDELYEDFIA